MSMSISPTTSTNPVSGTFQVQQGVPPEMTYGDCASGTDGVNPTICIAEPVNTYTGSYTTSSLDARLPGIGIPFVFQRTYNSADGTAGPLGVGWTHAYNAFLAVLNAGARVVLHAGDGQQLGFTRQGDGSYDGDPGVLDTLVKNPDGTYLLTRPDQTAYAFDSGGKLTSLRERNNQGLSFGYQAGILSTITDSAGRAITLTTSSGRITKLTLAGGRFVSYGYTSGRLTSVTDLRGGTTQYTYDGSGRLASIVNQNGHTLVQNVYGSDGRVTQQSNAAGISGTFSWDAANMISTMTDANGGVWTDVYQGGRLVRQVDPAGNQSIYGYDLDLNETSFTDASGRTWTNTYDGRGNRLTRTAPGGVSIVETWTYTGKNDVDTYTSPLGNIIDYGYDPKGNLTSITRPGGNVTTLEHNATTGLITKVVDPRLKAWTYSYDAQGNLTQVLSPLQAKTTLTYDASGRLKTVVEPRGYVGSNLPADYTWTYTYDAADNLTQAKSPLGFTQTSAFDPAGNLDLSTDEKNRTTDYTYDLSERLTSVVAPGARTTSYEYDILGNLLTRTDPLMHQWSYDYNSRNLLESSTSPMGRVWSFTYTPTGQVASKTLPSGNFTAAIGDDTASYSYDPLDRLTSIGYSDATADVTMTYNKESALKTLTDGGGTATYTYDNLGRFTSVVRGSDTFAYEYDAASNVTKRTYPNNAVTTYIYNDDGQMTSVTNGANSTSYLYDAAGNLTKTTLPSGNGYVETRTIDRDGRTTAITNKKGTTTLSSATYVLDATGNPTRVDAVGGVAVTTFKYDPNTDFLTEACFQATCTKATSPFIRYSYDKSGNRLTEIRSSGTTDYVYNADDKLTSATAPSGTTNYTYDRNGNQTGAGTKSFGFDLEDRMISADTGSALWTYSYDGLGRRTQATSGANTTKFLWDENGSLPTLAVERDGSDALVRRYVYGQRLVSMRSGGADYFYHSDRMGSTMNVTSSTGAKMWTYSYEPFGGNWTAPVKNNTAAPANLMRYTGEYFDNPTNLYHLRARQYRSRHRAVLAARSGIDGPRRPLRLTVRVRRESAHRVHGSQRKRDAGRLSQPVHLGWVLCQYRRGRDRPDLVMGMERERIGDGPAEQRRLPVPTRRTILGSLGRGPDPSGWRSARIRCERERNLRLRVRWRRQRPLGPHPHLRKHRRPCHRKWQSGL